MGVRVAVATVGVAAAVAMAVVLVLVLVLVLATGGAGVSESAAAWRFGSVVVVCRWWQWRCDGMVVAWWCGVVAVWRVVSFGAAAVAVR